MNRLPPGILLDGSTKPRPRAIPLRAGPVTMIFEPDTAFLRYLRIGDHEVIRAIYGAVRDQNWDTITPQLSKLECKTTPESFDLSFEAECKAREIDFFWKGTITGDPQGKITFRFDGEARSSFSRNRIGICVLHPITECAGKSCTIEKVDGAKEQGIFPQFISPHQPFKHIRAITQEVAPGVRAEIRFEGETFEMEDQRNWTDASFKTYSTPLELPMPVRVEKGSRVQQSATISVAGEARKVLPVLQGRSAQFSISTTPVLAKPAIGLKSASHGQPLSAKEIERLKRLRLSHLRLDLKLSDPHCYDALRRVSIEAAQLSANLHLALFLSDNADQELEALVRELKALDAKPQLVMVFRIGDEVTQEKWVRLARERLAEHNPNILVAAGTTGNFVDINRNRPAPDSRALPCYPVNPQIHAFDNTSMIENLGGPPCTVESARQFCSQSVVISQITLRPQPGSPTELPPDSLPAWADPRQMSLFGAGWTLGSLARLANISHIHSLTYFETTGCLGIMQTEKGSPGFPAPAGGVYPVYHLFADMAEFNRILPTHSSHPLQVEGLTLLDPQNRRRILVANLLNEPQDIKIKTGTCKARVRHLNESTAESAMTSPETFRGQAGEPIESVSGKIELKLLPFALACVDII